VELGDDDHDDGDGSHRPDRRSETRVVSGTGAPRQRHITVLSDG